MSSNKKIYIDITLNFDGYEWNDDKKVRNLAKHLIDFEDAISIFENPILCTRSDQNGEFRYIAIGLLGEIEVVVVYTERNGICRVISARRARNNERNAYHKAFPSGP